MTEHPDHRHQPDRPYDEYYEPRRQHVEAAPFDDSAMDPALIEHPYGPHVNARNFHPHRPVNDKPDYLLFPTYRPAVQDNPPPSPQAAERDPRKRRS